ncbi:MAG: exo-alpha-sialidase [Candidatus Latescibacteria bacterium]|nr:exo-alpha-sialidase [Candidatus Latescibacterota bacterium]
MRFERLEEGFINRRPESGPTAVAATPRCAVTDSGEVACSCVTQAALGGNDFKPMLSRSRDGGRTWEEQGLIWPEFQAAYSITGAVSRSPEGALMLFGQRTPIDVPGESFWSDATQGIKQNELIWSISSDGGRTWAEPTPVPLPIPGSAEVPGALCVTRKGAWVGCYAPYNTFDPAVHVDRNQVVFVRSEDRGRTWGYGSMLRFEEPDSGGAEAWVIELADGRLLGTGWHLDLSDKTDYPNAYALSRDGGRTWSPTRSTGTMGQSTGLGALPDGRALFIYNQRKYGEPGVRLAVCRPTESDFGIELDDLVWSAQTRTQGGTSGDHTQWQDFSFGEPSVTPLPDGSLLVAFWCIQPAGRGIGYVRLAIR